MASVNWQNKMKTVQDVKAKFRHNVRANLNYGNKDIDASKSDLNVYDRDYDTLCSRFDDKIAELDRAPKANKRKDRVLVIGLEIPIPRDLNDAPRDEQLMWFTRVHQIIDDELGTESDLGMFIHYDEQHEYVNNKRELVMSRVHAHNPRIPIVNGRLNGKAFSSRDKIITINNRIEIMTEREFGCMWLTGAQTKSNQSVLSVKNESKARELDMKVRELEQRARQTAQDRTRILAEAHEEAEQIKADAYEEADRIRERSKRLNKVFISDKSLRAANVAKTVDNKSAHKSGITREQVIGDYGAKVQIENLINGGGEKNVNGLGKDKY